jgi:hypothetical protein
LVFAAVSSMKTIRVGSKVQLSLEPRLARRVHRAAALFGGVRRLFCA